MGFLDKFRSFVSSGVKTRPGKEGSHGNHWETVTELDRVESVVMDSMKNPDSVETFEYDDVVGVRKKGQGPLEVCTITVDGAMLTSYPAVSRGARHEVAVEEVLEWDNGIEAQVRGGLEDAYISFFDTRYFANKNSYSREDELFSLSALSYTLYEADEEVIESDDGEKYSTEGMSALFPIEDGDIDDFLFHGPAKSVDKVRFLGNEFYEITTPVFRTSMDADVDLVIYASSGNEVSGGYVPEEGDDIAGVIWMQGYKTDT